MEYKPDQVRVFIIQRAKYVSNFNKLTKVQDHIEQEIIGIPFEELNSGWIIDHYKDAKPLDSDVAQLISDNIQDLF